MRKTLGTVVISVVAFTLAACSGGGDSAAGGETLANGMTVAEQIKARQKGFKSIGSAFKAVREEIKKDSPDMAVLEEAAATLTGHANEMDQWFPEGTGPDSGVKTEALAAIWDDPDGFASAIDRFKASTSEFESAVVAADMAVVGNAPRLLGSACKNCHDNYRLDD